MSGLEIYILICVVALLLLNLVTTIWVIYRDERHYNQRKEIKESTDAWVRKWDAMVLKEGHEMRVTAKNLQSFIKEYSEKFNNEKTNHKTIP